MAKKTKEIKSSLKLLVPGGGATPAPPVGSALGQHGVNIMDFCKQFNAKTSDRKGETVPVVVTVYKDRSFSFIIKTSPTSELIKKKAGIKKGSSLSGDKSAGKISWSDIEEIAKVKLMDLNTRNVDEAKKVVAGTARSMGVEVFEG